MARNDPHYTAPIGKLVRIKTYGKAHEILIGQIDPKNPETDVICTVPPGKIGMIVGTYRREDGKNMPIIMINNVSGWIFQDEYEEIDAL